MKRIARGNLSAEVLEQILNYINDNQLKPGDKLPTEEDLCERLGVSRTAVREALKGLKERGIINSVPGRGTFISSPDVAVVARTISSLLMLQQCSIQDVYEIRESIEISLAKKASVSASPEQLSKIEECYEKLNAQTEDIEEALVVDRDFHVAIADASGNHLGQILVDAMMLLTVDLRRSQFTFDDNYFEMHKRIYLAFKEGNTEMVEDAMTHHFDIMAQILDKS